MLSWLRFFWFVPVITGIILLAVLWLELVGLPHLAWQYRYQGRPGGRFAYQYYVVTLRITT